MSYTLRVNGKNLSTLNGYSVRQVIHKGNTYPLNNMPSAKPEGYLLFSSPEEFSMTFTANCKYDGQLQYNTDGEWLDVVQGTAITSVNNQIKIRGIGNTYCGYHATAGINLAVLTLQGSNICCKGNIATLLDYETVNAGSLPVMATYAFTNLFANCTELKTAPELPFTELTEGCYMNLFASSGIVLAATTLPATVIPNKAYSGLYDNTTTQGILDLRHVTTINAPSSYGTIDYIGNNITLWFSPNLTAATDGICTGGMGRLSGAPTYNMYFFFTDDNEVLFTPKNFITNAGTKFTATFNIYTDNTVLHDQFLAAADSKALINVYHLDGTSWPLATGEE